MTDNEYAIEIRTLAKRLCEAMNAASEIGHLYVEVSIRACGESTEGHWTRKFRFEPYVSVSHIDQL